MKEQSSKNLTLNHEHLPERVKMLMRIRNEVSEERNKKKMFLFPPQMNFVTQKVVISSTRTLVNELPFCHHQMGPGNRSYDKKG